MEVTVVAREEVVGSLQPNQPGVLQVVVLVVGVVVVVVVVLSSKQPHHPGVLQVVVVLVVVVELVEVGDVVVVISDPLLRKYFHN